MTPRSDLRPFFDGRRCFYTDWLIPEIPYETPSPTQSTRFSLRPNAGEINIDRHHFTIESHMPVQIANPQVVAKIERLSGVIGVGKTAAVEAAVDRMLDQLNASPVGADPWVGRDAIIAQMRQISPRPDAFEAVAYDEMGLPR